MRRTGRFAARVGQCFGGAVLERTVAFAGERTAFGRPVGRFQAIRHKLAEMAVRVETSRAVTYNALRLFAAGVDATREVTIAKLKSQRDCYEVADAALQIHGGAGVSDDTVLARFWASACTLRIVDGPDAVHIRSVAREELERERPYAG